MNQIDHRELFAQWWAEHGGAIVQVARAYTWSDADREELTQEILMQCWMSLENFRGHSAVSTWFYRIALNTALKWKRSDKSRNLLNCTISFVNVPDSSLVAVESEVQQSDTLKRLGDAIRRLNESDRAIVLLHLDQLTYAEIAEIVGISESNVGIRLHRVRGKLRQLMGACDDD